MKTLREFIDLTLTESYVNAIGLDQNKEKYKEQVWDLLQKSYSHIGGVKGSGFSSPDDMVKNIPFWKMAIKDGKVEVVIMYKDKGGRKSVAMGSTGSPWARVKVADMLKNDIYRSYGEKSKAALGALMKQHPWELLVQFLVPVKEVAKSENIIPIKQVPQKEWPDDAKQTLEKYPKLIDYGYLREIGGTMTFKVMIGSPGNKIV